MPSTAGQKRKINYHAPGTAAQARKRQKGRDARAIPTQTADAALSTTGELNIAAFVKSREFEIAALESGMKKARKSLSARAFQQVPRHLRRRTASHNVKKIPRRLRTRAAREILEDNTPTGAARKKKPTAKMRLRLETAKKLQSMNERRKKLLRQKKQEAKINSKESDPSKHTSTIERIPRIKKNKLADPPQATSKFKRRQVSKTWLPTHLWHAKRAHMTRPTMPLWKIAIPITPTEKSYRSTHRASSTRGCVAWDTSYMSTICCQGKDDILEKMLKMLGFSGEKWSGSKYKRWKAGTRHSEGWVYEQSHGKTLICTATVIWQKHAPEPIQAETSMELDNEHQSKGQKKKLKLDRKLFIRVHPSAFHQFWIELLKAAKAQRPQVLVEDLRFEIGSLELIGPGATEAIIAVSRLAQHTDDLKGMWPVLPSLSDPATLPPNALLIYDIYDPRLNHPPRQLKVQTDDNTLNQLNQAIVTWQPDRSSVSSRLFDQKTRFQSTSQLPSQKAINRRRQELLPGQSLEPIDKDPRIPVMLLANRSQSGSDSKDRGSWTMLLPWRCVDLVWRSLMYYPLTSGSTPRFGGLDQTRQVAFEASLPWFPADHPGTEAGKAWERTQLEKRFDVWSRRPPSKRFSWDTIDLGYGRRGEHGRGWACDWEFLLTESGSTTKSVKHLKSTTVSQPLLTQRQRKAALKVAAADVENDQTQLSQKDEGEIQDEVVKECRFGHVTPQRAATFQRNGMGKEQDGLPLLATIRFHFLTKGTPKDGARIYRLPLKSKLEIQDVDHPKAGPQRDTGASVTPILFAEKVSPEYDANVLRQRWLKQDPQALEFNVNSSTDLPSKLRKEHRNSTGDVAQHKVFDTKSAMDLSHIRVFPPNNKHKEVHNMFGPKPPPRSAEDMLKVYQPQAIPNLIVKNGDLVEEGLWDKHVPCPESGDLLGFVTSAGYNLSEGRGTGIGSIWLQRLLDGWKTEDAATVNDGGMQQTMPNQSQKSVSKAEQQQIKQIERQRHLCIVRNAGESVGRLALWEMC